MNGIAQAKRLHNYLRFSVSCWFLSLVLGHTRVCVHFEVFPLIAPLLVNFLRSYQLHFFVLSFPVEANKAECTHKWLNDVQKGNRASSKSFLRSREGAQIHKWAKIANLSRFRLGDLEN